MKNLILILLFACSLRAGDVAYILQAGGTQVSILNTGPLGGTFIWNGRDPVNLTDIGRGTNTGGKLKVVFDHSGFFGIANATSQSTCGANPCTVLLNREISRIGVSLEVLDSGGSSLTPPVVSNNQQFLPLVAQPANTAPFVLPALADGRGQTNANSFSIAGGTDVSALSAWVLSQNLRPEVLSVLGNSGTERKFTSTPLIDITTTGTVCTCTTGKPHGLSTGQVIDIRMLRGQQGNGEGIAQFNGRHTVTVTGATTFTTPCTLPADRDPHWGTTGNGVAGDFGAYISASVYTASEASMWWGGIHGVRQLGEYLVPFGASEFTAGATNTLTFRFNGQNPSELLTYGLTHGIRILDWALVQPRVEITQIVVSGAGATHLNAVATAPGYDCHVGETAVIIDPPGPRWRFAGKQIITACGSGTFTFLWGQNTVTGTAGVAPYDTPNGTYVVPTSINVTYAPPPHMYAARSLNPKTDFTARTRASFADYGGNAGSGETFFKTGTLLDPSPYPAAHATQTTCGGCHKADGEDLWFYSAEPEVIRMATLDRGGSTTDAANVVKYIASFTGSRPAKAWMWNPPYQPGPGMSTGTTDEWRAGSGIEWFLTYDNDMKEWMCPSGNCATEPILDYNGSLNAQDLPTVLQAPHINRWWPEIHPLDYYQEQWGVDFTSTDIWGSYVSILNSLTAPQQLSAGINNSVTTVPTSVAFACTTNDYAKFSDGSEYVKITAGCGTTSLTVTRGVSPTGGISATATSHSSGAWLSNWSSYYRAGTGFGLGTPFLGELYYQYTASTTTYQAPLVQGGGGGFYNPSQFIVGSYGVTKWMNKNMLDWMTTFRLQEMNDKATQKQNESGGSIGGRLISIVVGGCVSVNCTATMTTDVQAGGPIGVGGHIWVRGCTVDTDLCQENYTILTATSGTAFTFATVNVTAGTYTDSGMSFGTTGINTRSPAQSERGWTTNTPFCTGEHKCKGGGTTQTLNAGSSSDTNFDYDTAAWYDHTQVLSIGNRLGVAAGNIAWEYTAPFNYAMNRNRPAQYTSYTCGIEGAQSSIGRDLIGPLGNGASSSMGLFCTLFNYVYQFPYQNLLISVAEQTALVKRTALTWANLTDQFSTAEWKASYHAAPIDLTPDVQASQNQSGANANALASATAYGLAIMNYFGVSTTVTDRIITWANAVFTGTIPGGTFATYRGYTCTPRAELPYVLDCVP